MFHKAHSVKSKKPRHGAAFLFHLSRKFLIFAISSLLKNPSIRHRSSAGVLNASSLKPAPL
jgi:hypothetical protein